MLRLELGNKSSGSGFNSSTDVAHLKPRGRKPSRNSHCRSQKGPREAMDGNRGASSGRYLCSGCDPVCSCPRQAGSPSPSALGTSSCRACPARHTAHGWGPSLLPGPQVRLKARGALTRGHSPHSGLCHQQQNSPSLPFYCRIREGRGMLSTGDLLRTSTMQVREKGV